MSAQYIVSGEIGKRAYYFVSFVWEDAVEFYPHHAGRQSESRSDAIRFNEGENNLQG